MVVERKKLKSIEINIEKNVFKLNGEDMKGVSRLDIDYDNGNWTLLVTKDEIYTP